MTENLASHGYIVLAVDLYDGRVATTTDEARSLIIAYEEKVGIENMNSAVTYLKQDHNVEKIGTIGWCFGGGQSLILSLNNQDVDATVMYYGQVTSDSEKLSKINWPVLGIFAELDKGILVENVKKFETALNDLQISNEIIIYSGVDHAFANPSGMNFAPQETMDAWQKTITFFEQELK